jgi:hypothetical protein
VIEPLEDGSTPFDYWSRYADAGDTDTAKLAFSHAIKFYFRAQRQQEFWPRRDVDGCGGCHGPLEAGLELF